MPALTRVATTSWQPPGPPGVETQQAVSGPHACTDKGCVGPGKGLFKRTAVTTASKLGSTSLRRRQTSVEADRQHQTHRRPTSCQNTMLRSDGGNGIKSRR